MTSQEVAITAESVELEAGYPEACKFKTNWVDPQLSEWRHGKLGKDFHGAHEDLSCAQIWFRV